MNGWDSKAIADKLRSGKVRISNDSAYRIAVQNSVKKSGRQDALVEKTEVSRINSPVSIKLHIYRRGERWDIDNNISKCILDGLVHSGIIKDDCFKFVKSISAFGHKVKAKEEERTIIEVWARKIAL